MLTLLNKKILFFCLSITFFLQAKKPTPHFSQEKNNVSISVRSLDKNDIQTLFNCHNPIKAMRLNKQYKALEITIENKTEQEYVLEQSNIDLKLENTLVIKSKVKANPFIVPVVTVASVITLLIVGLGVAVLPSVFAGATIGVTTLNLNMGKSNKISTKRIQTKTLDTNHPTLIPSYSKIQKVIFVAAKNAKECFAITLESLGSTQKTQFDINLANKP